MATVFAVYVQYRVLRRAARNDVGSTAPSPLDRAALFRLGLPVGLQMSAEMGVFAVTGVLAGRFGATAMAAHQVVLQLASLTFTMALGVAKAGSVAVGYAVGGRRRLLARRMGLLTFAMCGLLMLITAITFAALPQQLIAIFSPGPAVVSQAVPLLGIAALFQIADGLQCAGGAVLRGAGDMRFPFLANLLGYNLAGMPVALLLAYREQLGVYGLWTGLCIGLWTVAAVLVWRFLYVASREIVPIVPARPTEPAASAS
jgi:MATE family multidrug resistance protein